MNSNPYLTSIVTASVAFAAAVVAQIISHWLTKKRENIKYNKEVYQKLYAPILFELYVYLDVKTAYTRVHDIKPGIEVSVIKENILKHINVNLMYGTPQIISAFHNVKYYDYHEDLCVGNLQSIAEIELFWCMLDQLYRLNEKTKLFDPINKNTLVKYKFHYILWAIISKLRGEDAYYILTYKHNLHFDKSIGELYKSLNKDFTRFRLGHQDKQFLRRSLEKTIIKLTNGSGEFSPHGKTYLERSKNT
ncbi:hypothetical protein QFZ81_001005 [Paenibacillus sp. V4I9]|uniref:hypothetical protein n=1 Tax=Paenibacillus sp. V4I9 TaxID=3042308 RepID=UPI002787672A|nr:hypothetical protein [Paenibacillus sp. V4I9]MDQ0885917.1 hypothetical protein [Paenibacillus sp. V4I9]